MRTMLPALGAAILMASAGCAAPPPPVQTSDAAVMGSGVAAPQEGAAIAESLGFHGPRRSDDLPAR